MKGKMKSDPMSTTSDKRYAQPHAPDALTEEPASPAYWLGMESLDVHAIRTDFDLIELGNKGVSKLSLEKITEHLGLSKRVMAEEILDISVKTLERKTLQEKLDKRTSSHIIEMAKLIQHAFTVFRNREKVKSWMHSEHKALNKEKPVNLLHSLTGINMVHDLLGRIEEGVYS